MHTLVFVIIPQTTQEIQAEVNRLLLGSEADPTKVYPEYDTLCTCLDRAYLDCVKGFNESPQGIELTSKLDLAREIQNPALEQELLKVSRKAVTQMERAHPDYQKPNPACDLCHGTGAFAESRDPRRHWDYWQLGGRWSDVFCDVVTTGALGQGPLPEGVVRVRCLPEKRYPAALVTPDGYWHEGPFVMGFSIGDEFRREDEKRCIASWMREVQEIRERYADDLAVAVDAHS
jgi:hypothetical protein